MTNDLDALVERVKELHAQLEACRPEERRKRIELRQKIERIYYFLLKRSEDGL